MNVQRVQIPYSPRRQFMPFHERTKRWFCIVAHRRAGKTVACLNDLQKAALLCERERPRFAYMAPFLKQAKSVAWDYMLHYSSPIPGIQVNHSELRVDYPNGGQVRLWGADNAEAMRGIYLDGIVVDEPADQHPRIWPEIIRPALADRRGFGGFIGTPKGHNGFYDIREIARTDPDWLYLELKASQTGLLAEEELIAARKTMTEDQYEQEFECSFDAAIVGAYYGKLMRQAQEEGRITRVPWDPRLLVYTSWDLGIGDHMVIWFWQINNGEYRLIDYYESFGNGLAHYAKVLKEKPYVYAEHIAPHDAAVDDLSTGKARSQTMSEYGINWRIMPRVAQVSDRIQITRSILPLCWFDAEKCKQGIEALMQYQCEYDEERKIFSDRPLHNWASHPADSFGEGARGIPNQTMTPPKRQRYSNSGKGGGTWMSA